MDQLPVGEQEKLKKCSDERLKQKLVKAGRSEDEVKALARAALLTECAELKLQTLAEAAAVFGTGKPAYDPEVERMRLAFEQQKWQQEREEREKQWQQEKEEREKQRQFEREQQAEVNRLKEIELKLEKEKLERNEALQKHLKDEELKMKQKDIDRHETVVSKMKLFGDTLRNSVTRMSNDPVEIVSFFRSVEQLYKSLGVPADLQSALVRPHLNERARNLVTKLSPEVAGDYGKLRDAILAEYKLSPNTYLDRFNSLTCSSDETTVMFASKLETLFNYYLEARKVNDFPDLRDLVICDRIKSTLSEPCLQYILSVESTKDRGWMSVRELTTAVDKYLGTHVGDKPRAYAIGCSGSQKPVTSQVVPGLTGKLPPPRPPPPKFFDRPSTGQGPAGAAVIKGNGSRRCFICNSPDHLRLQCPKNTANAPGTRFDTITRNPKKVNACSVDSGMGQTHTSRPSGRGPSSPSCGTVDDSRVEKSGCTVSMTSVSQAQDRAFAEAAAVFRGSSVGDASVNEVVAVAEQQQDLAGLSRSWHDCNDAGDSRVTATVHRSQLSYIPVEIRDSPSGGNSRAVRALADSGAEIALVSSKHIADFECTPLAKVQLRAFIGDAVEANIVMLYIRHTGEVCDDDERCVAVACAVCEDLREDLILTAAVIDKLCASRMGDGTADPRPRDKEESKDGSSDCQRDGHANACDGLECSRDDMDGENVNTAGVENSSDNIESNTGDAGNDDKSADVYDADGLVAGTDPDSATATELAAEQKMDDTLKGCWKLASKERGNFFVRGSILYHREMILGQDFEQLCLPGGRRRQVMELGHDIAGGHLGAKRTRERIKLSFWWPTLTRDVKEYVQRCEVCQK